MKTQKTKQKLPHDYWLDKLYHSPTFTHLKIELEGNQDGYYVGMEGCDCGDADCEDREPSDFLTALFNRTGYDMSDFNYITSYNDGSVDTEVTFTVPLTPNGVQMAQNMMREFGDLIDNTRKAGMHIAVLGPHAYTRLEPSLKPEGVKNLETQLNPIVPFINILGQSEAIHRGANYCSNRVGYGKDGYPAIYVQDNKRIEFRFFHPCYYQVDLFYHYLEVIAHMLEYYEHPEKKVKLHGGTGTYRHLLDTSEFNYYVQQHIKKLPETLAFADIFHQFTGNYVHEWKRATGFEPKTLQWFWTRKEHREALRAQQRAKALAAKRLKNKKAAEWLAGDKTLLYDELNTKGMKLS